MNADKWARRHRRAEDVKGRAASARANYIRCRVVGCPELTRAAAAEGLSNLYCRKHEEHFQRHGSYFKKSYTGPQLAPYRRAAEAWVRSHLVLPRVANAVESVRSLMDTSGSAEEAFRLRGRPPRERAQIAWARLRNAGADPVKVLSVWLAIELIQRDDPQPESKVEYRRVQAAKVLHRIASGTHKRWETPTASGRVVVQELHAYPQSRGRVLRHIGDSLERCAELVVQHHLEEFAVYARKRLARRRRAKSSTDMAVG